MGSEPVRLQLRLMGDRCFVRIVLHLGCDELHAYVHVLSLY
jgi:hypothetical protein